MGFHHLTLEWNLTQVNLILIIHSVHILKFDGQYGFEDQFLQSAVAFNNKIMTDVEWHITKIDEGIFMCANIYPDLDKVMDVQDAALKWLDEVEHMLILDDEGSRTEGHSGPLVRSFNS